MVNTHFMLETQNNTTFSCCCWCLSALDGPTGKSEFRLELHVSAPLLAPLCVEFWRNVERREDERPKQLVFICCLDAD